MSPKNSNYLFRKIAKKYSSLSETGRRGNLLRKSSRKFPNSIEPCLKWRRTLRVSDVEKMTRKFPKNFSCHFFNVSKPNYY